VELDHIHPTVMRDDDNDQLESYHDETPLRTSTEDPLLHSTSIDDPVEDDTPQEYPWMQRVSDNIPSPLKRLSSTVVNWVKGPQPPRIYKIDPIFPSIQHAPLNLLDRYAPKRMQRFWLLFVFYICWILSFALILQRSSFAADVEGYGSPIRWEWLWHKRRSMPTLLQRVSAFSLPCRLYQNSSSQPSCCWRPGGRIQAFGCWWTSEQE
jgi:hypothetical protein